MKRKWVALWVPLALLIIAAVLVLLKSRLPFIPTHTGKTISITLNNEGAVTSANPGDILEFNLPTSGQYWVQFAPDSPCLNIGSNGGTMLEGNAPAKVAACTAASHNGAYTNSVFPFTWGHGTIPPSVGSPPKNAISCKGCR